MGDVVHLNPNQIETDVLYNESYREETQNIKTKNFEYRKKEHDMTSTDWQEMYLGKLNQDINDIRNTHRELRQEMTSLKNELKHEFSSKIDGFLSELRDRDNQRIADMREIRSGISTMNEKIDSTNKHVQVLVLTSSIGIAGIVIAVIAFVVSAIIK